MSSWPEDLLPSRQVSRIVDERITLRSARRVRKSIQEGRPAGS